MDRRGLTLSLLGLFGVASPVFADETSKTEVNQERETSPGKSKYMKDTKSKSGDVSDERKVESTTKEQDNGNTVTETTKVRKHDTPSKARKSKTKEKTVRDSEGNVVSHEKTTE